MLNPSLKYLNPSSEELEEIAKLLGEKRGIKGYESMSEDTLLSALISSKPVKESEKHFDGTKPTIKFSKSRIEEITKKFNESRHNFSKSKINKIRRNLY